MVPTWTGKPEKIGKHFPVREMSGNFEQTGKVRNLPKILEKLAFYQKYWKSVGILAVFYFIFFTDFFN